MQKNKVKLVKYVFISFSWVVEFQVLGQKSVRLKISMFKEFCFFCNYAKSRAKKKVTTIANKVVQKLMASKNDKIKGGPLIQSLCLLEPKEDNS